MLRHHIKTLIVVNIIITSGILLTKDMLVSSMVFCSGLIAMIIFYDLQIFIKYFKMIAKFKYLFITLFMFQLLLRRQGEVLCESWIIKITDQGLNYAFNSLMRYMVIILSATMLGSASPYQMIKALRTWHLPEQVIVVVSFTIQFLRQLQVEFKILNNNLKKRNIRFKGKSIKKRLELVSQLVIPIIGRLFSDIKYKVIAMELNGYGHNKRVVSFKYKKCVLLDYAIMLGFMICFIMIPLFRQ